jgi:hypothetical protein
VTFSAALNISCQPDSSANPGTENAANMIIPIITRNVFTEPDLLYTPIPFTKNGKPLKTK